jgi:hypothetical protein
MIEEPEILMKYIKQGLSVFPVKLTKDGNKVQKKPAVEWRDYQTRMATQEEVEAWCAFLDFNAIGVATGKLSGILVIDIDDVDKDYGFKSTVKVKTQSGGTHFWYKWRPGVRNTVRIGDKPVDVRGDGGFVVIPPSQIDDKKYEWISKDFKNMPDFPEIVTKEEYKPIMTDLPDATEGNRNNTAIQVAGHLIAGTKKKFWETIAWSALKNWNNENVEPPMDERELRQTFDSCCTIESRKRKHEEDNVQIYYGDKLDMVQEELMSRWGDGITTSYPILDEYFKFLPEQLYLVSSPTHQGKTTLALNFASKIASFGHNVLFCSLEQGVFIAPRIKTILGGDIPPSFGMLDSEVLLDTDTLIDAVAALTKKPEIVVIDHLHFMKKDTKQGITGGIDQMISQVQMAAKVMKIPIMVIAHLRKLSEGKAPSLDDLRDSSYLAQIPSVIIQMKMDEDEDGNTLDKGKMYLRKNRLTQKKDVFGYKIHESGTVDIYELSTTKYKFGG